MAAFEGSWTVPTMRPVLSCAAAVSAVEIVSAAAVRKIPKRCRCRCWGTGRCDARIQSGLGMARASGTSGSSVGQLSIFEQLLSINELAERRLRPREGRVKKNLGNVHGRRREGG